MGIVPAFDTFNRKNRRNERNTQPKDYNCGGYAFRTFNWFTPYPSWNRNENVMGDLLLHGYSYDEIVKQVIEENAAYIQEILDDRVRRIFCPEEKQENEDLVAFRLALLIDTEYNEIIDDDFHFRIERNGVWYEKMGNGGIEVCPPWNEKVWSGGMFHYFDPTVLFAIKQNA